MRRTPHYTCRHSCNCDGRVRVYLPVRIRRSVGRLVLGRACWQTLCARARKRAREYVCLHLVPIFFTPSPLLVLLLLLFPGPCFFLSFFLLCSSPRPQNPVLFASGNGGPDMGVTTRGLKERRVIRNYTFSFAEIVFTNCSRHTAAVPLSVLFFSFFGRRVEHRHPDCTVISKIDNECFGIRRNVSEMRKKRIRMDICNYHDVKQ